MKYLPDVHIENDYLADKAEELEYQLWLVAELERKTPMQLAEAIHVFGTGHRYEQQFLMWYIQNPTKNPLNTIDKKLNIRLRNEAIKLDYQAIHDDMRSDKETRLKPWPSDTVYRPSRSLKYCIPPNNSRFTNRYPPPDSRNRMF